MLSLRTPFPYPSPRASSLSNISVVSHQCGTSNITYHCREYPLRVTKEMTGNICPLTTGSTPRIFDVLVGRASDCFYKEQTQIAGLPVIFKRFSGIFLYQVCSLWYAAHHPFPEAAFCTAVCKWTEETLFMTWSQPKEIWALRTWIDKSS